MEIEHRFRGSPTPTGGSHRSPSSKPSPDIFFRLQSQQEAAAASPRLKQFTPLYNCITHFCATSIIITYLEHIYIAESRIPLYIVFPVPFH